MFDEERCEDRCELCKYYRGLHHNFVKGKGFEESHCCILFSTEKDAFVLEVEPQGICEMFTEFTTGEPDAIVRCRNCEYLYFTDNCVPSEQSYVCDHWHTDITNIDGFCNFAKRKSN